MGYRSDLYALVHGSDLIPFLSALENHNITDSFTETVPMDAEGYTRFEAYGLKWYDSYEDVADVNTLFNKSKHSALLRLGEEPNDEEFHSGMYNPEDLFDITYTTSVEF